MRYPDANLTLKETDMAAYKHGEMNITAHERTFDGFIKFVARSIVVIIVLVILMALLDA